MVYGKNFASACKEKFQSTKFHEITPMLRGQEGQELPSIQNSFDLSFLVKGHVLALQTVWLTKMFQSEPTDPQSNMVQL